MRVLVTGGTGFVGAHTVAALSDAGHEVRVLARRPAQLAESLRPLGATVPDVAEGDVLDERAVARAMDGCDAVVHAAAVFSTDPRRAEEMRRTNALATERVVAYAAERGLDPVVHVSTTVALTRRGGSGPDLPLGDIRGAYAESKIASERVARRLQEQRAPVVTVYPGSVFGPHDPYRGEQGERVRWILRGLFPLWPAGGIHVVDVRDVARVIAAVLEPRREGRPGAVPQPPRYVVPGHHVSGAHLYGTLAELTGRRLPHVTLPGSVIGPATRLIDAVQARLPERWRYPADHEGAEVVLRHTRMDDSRARAELGVEPTPLADVLRDTVRWLVESGRLPARRAGRLG
ncbi:MAG: NAD-dependent epimerase/dehydratase family protein [Actinomycetes bacterium]